MSNRMFLCQKMVKLYQRVFLCSIIKTPKDSNFKGIFVEKICSYLGDLLVDCPGIEEPEGEMAPGLLSNLSSYWDDTLSLDNLYMQ